MNNQVPDAELVEYKLKVLVNTIRFTALPVRKHAEMAEGPLFNILTEASMGMQICLEDLPILIESERVPYEALPHIIRCAIAAMRLPDYPVDGTLREYLSSESWEKLRRHARLALRAMGEELRLPDINYV